MNGDTISSVMLKILGVLALVLLNGFFVAAELALVKIRGTQLDTLVLKGNRRAKIARKLIQNLDAAISATQLGITLASLGLGVLVEPVFAALLEPVYSSLHLDSPTMRHTISILVGFITNSFLLIVIGELAPKALAIRKTLHVALWTAEPLVWFGRIAYPFIWLLNHSAQWLLRQTGIAPTTESERAHSEEELRLLLGASQKQTAATKVGREIVLNALDLRRRIAREVMRPRQEIVVFDTEASMSECLDLAEKTRYSRFPLCEAGDLDKTLGVVHIKDLYALRNKARSGSDLLPAARKLIFVPESARLEKVLQLFLDRKLHMAIVVDEYGGTMGLLTLENILEELVGQIQDEFDAERPLLVRIGEKTWEASGALPVHDLAELLGQPLREEGVTTVSGWVTHRLGGFPKVGDSFNLGSHELRVEEVEGSKVARLKILRLAEKPGTMPPF